MGIGIKKMTLKLFVIGTFCCLTPIMGWPAIAIQAHIVSGTIMHMEANDAIKLDNGKIYYPSRKGLASDLQAGQAVTLRYTVEGGEKNVFFEYAFGLDTLKDATPAGSRKHSTP